MPRIGRFEYPVIDIDRASSYVTEFMEKCKGESARDVFIVEVLKLSTSSSRPKSIIGALTQYKLLRAERGRIFATDLAETIAYGEEEEKVRAKAKACLNIELFKRYYEKYGTNVREDLLRTFLRDAAGASPREVQKELSSITRILSKDMEYVKQVEGMEKPEMVEKAPPERIIKPLVAMPSISVEGNSITLRIPLNMDAIEFAEKELPDMLKKYLEWAKRQVKREVEEHKKPSEE